jgi:hypothetical protein
MTAVTESEAEGEAAPVAPYDVETIRTDFPILFRDVYGKPLVYLDNGASAQKPRSVIDAIDYAYKMEYANVHRGLHFLSNATTSRFEDARETVRRFLNAPSTDEIIFTRNLTDGVNLVASSFGMDFKKGDEIVISIMEHTHRAPALPPRAQGLGPEVGTDLRHRRVPSGGVRAPLTRARAWSPSRRCRTCWAPWCRSGRWCTPTATHPGAGRWRPGRCTRPRRRTRLRLLRLHRHKTYADRHRRLYSKRSTRRQRPTRAAAR